MINFSACCNNLSITVGKTRNLMLSTMYVNFWRTFCSSWMDDSPFDILSNLICQIPRSHDSPSLFFIPPYVRLSCKSCHEKVKFPFSIYFVCLIKESLSVFKLFISPYSFGYGGFFMAFEWKCRETGPLTFPRVMQSPSWYRGQWYYRLFRFSTLPRDSFPSPSLAPLPLLNLPWKHVHGHCKNPEVKTHGLHHTTTQWHQESCISVGERNIVWSSQHTTFSALLFSA